MPLVYRSQDRYLPEEFDDIFPGYSVLFFDPRTERNMSPVGNLFRTLAPSESSAEIVVFRGPAGIGESMETDDVLRKVLGDRPTYALSPPSTGNGAPTLTQPSWSSSGPLDSAEFGTLPVVEATLRTAEVRAILTHSKAIWTAEGNYHFALPSGKHADTFIRIAEALVDWVDVSRIADWLMPHLSASTAVLADTGGMLALLLQLQLHAKQRCGWQIVIDTLRNYPDGPVDVRDVLNSLANRRRTDDPLLFLVSVNSSGNLISIFQSLTSPGTCHVVAVCDTLNPASPRVDALTTADVKRWEPDSEGKCPQCANSHPVQVDRQTYELVPFVGISEPTEIGRDVAVAHLDFWEAAYRQRAISLHREVAQPGLRHHPVYIDVPAILQDPSFRGVARSRLVDSLRLADPELVLLMKHSSTDALHTLLDEALQLAGLSGPVNRIEVTGDSLGDDASIVGRASRILVLDDAIVTGKTVLRLKQRIYRENQKWQKHADVSLFVVILRPPSNRVRRSVVNHYTHKSVRNISCAAEFILPGEGAENCTWCSERRALRLWGAKLPALPDVFEERLKKLDSQLESPLLMGDTAGQAARRTEGSFWGTLDEVTAFAAVSAAVTEIALSVDQKAQDFQQKYVSLRLVFDAYYDQSIRAAALRSVEPRHVRHEQQDSLFPEWLAAIDTTTCTPGLLSELAYAAALTKIPSAPVLELLDRCDDGSALLRFLKEIVRLGTTVE